MPTCQGCHGFSDDYDEANLRRCSGCRNVYYCSTTCQNDDWPYHIFNCNTNHPIHTAYYLARAVRDDEIPVHSQTCEDYGFNRAYTEDEKSKLLSLYIGLIKYLEVPPKTIHQWRVRGVLVDEIKAAYCTLPEDARGEYFPWFLQNQHIIAQAGQPLSEERLQDHADAMLVRAWRFIGGSHNDSPQQIRVVIASKPEDEQNCLWLYVLLLHKWRPSPALDLWVDFGFAACRSQLEETQLENQYEKLINLCTFVEFRNAHRMGRLLLLFRSKGLQVNEHRHLGELLGGAVPKKSVWYLKQSVFQEDITKAILRMYPAVLVDYGFINCENDIEKQHLKSVYKAFFDNPNADPWALHEAAIQGNIRGFLSRFVQGLQDPMFGRLMQNLYPLPEPED